MAARLTTFLQAMRTRSGRQYSALTNPKSLSRSSQVKVTRTNLTTRVLLQAALDTEDARQNGDGDDAEGAILAYGDTEAADTVQGSARRQARDLTLIAAAAPPLNSTKAPQYTESNGNIERKRKRFQSTLRKKKRRIADAQSSVFERPGLPVRSSRRNLSVTASPVAVAFKNTDIPGAGQGEYVGKRITTSKDTPWTLTELREKEGFSYKTWDGRYFVFFMRPQIY